MHIYNCEISQEQFDKLVELEGENVEVVAYGPEETNTPDDGMIEGHQVLIKGEPVVFVDRFEEEIHVSFQPTRGEHGDHPVVKRIASLLGVKITW